MENSKGDKNNYFFSSVDICGGKFIMVGVLWVANRRKT